MVKTTLDKASRCRCPVWFFNWSHQVKIANRPFPWAILGISSRWAPWVYKLPGCPGYNQQYPATQVTKFSDLKHPKVKFTNVYKVLLVVLSTFTSIVLHGFRGKCRPFRRVCEPSDGWKCGETSWKSAPTQAALPDGSKFAETPQDFWKWIDNFWTQVGHEIWMLTESKAPLFSLEQDCSCHRSVAWSTKPDSSSMKMTPQDPTSRGALDEGKSFVQKSWQGFQQVCRYGFLACF